MKRIIAFILTLSVIMLITSTAVGAYSYDDVFYDNYYEEDYYNYEVEGDETKFGVVKTLLIAFVVGLVISLIVTGVMRSKMKSVRFERAARNYIRTGSMNVTRSHDTYLYSHVTKTPKPQNDKKR